MTIAVVLTVTHTDAIVSTILLCQGVAQLGAGLCLVLNRAICAPKDTSHAKVSATERNQMGISDSLLRLSVGVEDAEDLIADIARALGD